MTELADTSADCLGQYLVSHGKSGAVGSFATRECIYLRRGDRVIIDSSRGREVGTVLCPANIHQARLLGPSSSGSIVRLLSPDDEETLRKLRVDEDYLFQASRQLARARRLPVEILDSEILLEGGGLVQFVGAGDAALESFAQELSQTVAFEVRLENLAMAQEANPSDEVGCGKPDCGKTASGGCSTCDNGGGCSSCGSGKVDLRAYFGNLRDQMEASQRTSLSVT